jgi:hypothetical protein
MWRELRLRAQAWRRGWKLERSRLRGAPHPTDMGGYRLTNRRGQVFAGANWELSLADAEKMIVNYHGHSRLSR